MARGRGTGKKIRHDARNWIVKGLESGDRTMGMISSDLQARIRKLKGSGIPKYSFYNAIRTLVRRQEVNMTRRGREMWLKLAGSTRGSAPVAAAAPDGGAMESSAPAPAPVAAGSMHKLAPGEVTILDIGKSHIETATNVHGKLVLERHKRPR
jgi:hypothetical protein